MLGGGGRGEAQGMVWGFDIVQKFVLKFPGHGQIIPVKCTKISQHLFVLSGLLQSGKSQGKTKNFQGQGNVREFFNKSGNSVFRHNASRLAMGL